MTSVPAAHFERLYREHPDPWGFTSSAYEHAKYERTLAALGGRVFGRTLELGCSIGVLTRRLAGHCAELVACDAAPTAVLLARERTADQPHVAVVAATLPDELPPGPWELVVASEVLYYLDAPALERTLDAVEAALVPGGTLLAVHWTRPTRTHPLQGDAVHDTLVGRPALQRTRAECHADYRLDRFTRR